MPDQEIRLELVNGYAYHRGDGGGAEVRIFRGDELVAAVSAEIERGPNPQVVLRKTYGAFTQTSYLPR